MTFFFLVVGPRGQARARPRRAARAPPDRDPGARGARRDGGAGRDLPRVQRRRRRARTAGARRCRPTPPSRSARWRCSRRASATRLRVFLLTLAVVDDLVRADRDRDRLHGARLDASRWWSRSACSACCWRCATCRPARGQLSVVVGGRAVGGDVQVGHRPGDLRASRSGWSTSAYPPSREDLERATALARSFREQPTPELARSAQQGVLSAISPNERLQYGLHPWTSYVIVPLFALANAGIHVTGGAARRRDHLADHARDPLRLRGRQADRHPRRLVARVAAGAARTAPAAQLAGAGRRRRGRRASASPSRC